MARRPFTGPLAEPIDVGNDLDPRRWGPDLTDDERAGLIREKTLQLCLAGQAKLPALFAHYEVDLADPHGWESLALKLALDFVPGLADAHLVRRSEARQDSAQAPVPVPSGARAKVHR